MRQDKRVDALQHRRRYVLSVLPVRLRLPNHRLEHLALQEDRLALLVAAVDDPLLREHELLSVHLLL